MSKFCQGDFYPAMSRIKYVEAYAITNKPLPLFGMTLNQRGGYGIENPNMILASPFSPIGFCYGNRLSVYVTTAFNGVYARLGIYQDNGDFYPGRLIFDSGAINPGSSAPVWKDLSTATWAFRPDKIYWAASWYSQNAGGELSGSAVAEEFQHTGYYAPRSNTTVDWHRVASYGYFYPLIWNASTPLPDPFPSGCSVSYYAQACGFWVRTV